MTQTLASMMQDDFPLTLNHIRRRMRSCNVGAEVVTLLDDGSVARASAWVPASALEHSPGTTSATSSSTWPSRARVRSCTR